MYLIRDIVYCKPGQVRPLVDKFKAMAKLLKKKGFTSPRIVTDVCAERYWTVVAEMEVEDFEQFVKESRNAMSDREMQKIMKGYHDMVESGRREIYMIES